MDESGLQTLGLDALQARVLVIVIAEEEVTAATLCAATGASLPAVSVAVTALIRRGLVERVPHRRPSVIFIHPGASEVVAALAAAAEEAHQRARAKVAQAVEAVAQASARQVERGRPFHELQPRPRGVVLVSRWPGRRGRTAHDEVIAAEDVVHGTASLSLVGCPARVLVTGVEVDLELVACRQQPGSEVRATDLSLPGLWLLDRARVGIVAGTRDGQALVWSHDDLHVRAAGELFALWWEAAGSGVVTPERPALCEHDLEVDEWDPEDLPDGPDGPDGPELVGGWLGGVLQRVMSRDSSTAASSGSAASGGVTNL